MVLAGRLESELREEAPRGAGGGLLRPSLLGLPAVPSRKLWPSGRCGRGVAEAPALQPEGTVKWVCQSAQRKAGQKRATVLRTVAWRCVQQGSDDQAVTSRTLSVVVPTYISSIIRKLASLPNLV